MNYKQIFKSIVNWDNFVSSLSDLSKKEKGDAFEFLTKCLFEIKPQYTKLYDNVWLLSEVPQKELEYLELPFHDLGIDLIAKTGNEYHAIQCKYHSDKYQSVTFKEVSTFTTLVEGNPKISKGYICSSALSTSKNLDKVSKGSIIKLLGDTWQDLDEEFFKNVNKKLQGKAVKITPYKPFQHQKKAIKDAVKHFVQDEESRGKLIFPCGAGKSLTGYWIIKELNPKSTIIAVPSLSLVKQTLEVYLREMVANKASVKWLCICSDEGIGKNDDVAFFTDNLGVPCQTDPNYIESWLKANKEENKVIFTTYQSGRIIAELSKKLKITFDVGIFDEAHKTVGADTKLFSHLLFEKNINITKRVFMTATERFYAGSRDDIISMDDEDIYGETFTQMSFKEAIDAKLLTDYKVITIDIKKSEIAEFIKDNNLVQLNSRWKKETEARSLASMLALRKAMKRFNIKNAVSFHSSIEKATRNKELQKYITETYKYKPIDTYTVSGKIPTTKRNDIVQEFAKSQKALITNARCLTEGVDVPNIDCIVFADPRKSKVDIVQALGRALRKKEGKDWGYVILPVVYDGNTNEIDNDNFNEILSIVRGLAANDERIIEYFKDKSLGEGSKERSGGVKLFDMISETLSESDFAEQLSIKLWEKLSRFSWMPFEEAREFVRTLNIENQEEYWTKHKAGLIPKNIPFSPYNVYKQSGWKSYPDFLGYESLFRTLLSYEASKKIVQKFKLKSSIDWRSLDKSKLQLNIPKRPNSYYKDKGWVSWGDWLGYEPRRKNNANYLNYEEACKFVNGLGLKSNDDWLKYCKTGKIPVNIPKDPRKIYASSGWVGLGDWLGTGRIADQLKKHQYLSFEEARKYVQSLNLKNSRQWVEHVKEKNIKNIPRKPDQTYSLKGWNGWKDFLGITNNKKFDSFHKAQEWALKNNIKTKKEWKESQLRPDCFPKNPDYSAEYKKEWISWNKFLNKKDYLGFIEAKKFIASLKLKNQSEWRKYCKSSEFPSFIPKNPKKEYSDQWLGLGDWLGTGRVADQLKVFRSFEDVKKLVKNLGIKSQKEWFQYAKSGGKPEDVPYKPYRYKKEWKGWADFLGKE
ncbi:helicase [Formosa sp. Hel3_A1_48]|uniref:restriction endonuclease n=1 Tax=Formosa sp. Hel3_A1_48 TaxID=1336795 RepID=UPI00084E20B9|nr:DEAD/DEAH box helicase family protein [Formosa sp. Hel3_A1_48]AOR26470.1 helicase [Formosa sp. Hel3_A1_48]